MNNRCCTKPITIEEKTPSGNIHKWCESCGLEVFALDSEMLERRWSMAIKEYNDAWEEL